MKKFKKYAKILKIDAPKFKSERDFLDESRESGTLSLAMFCEIGLSEYCIEKMWIEAMVSTRGYCSFSVSYTAIDAPHIERLQLVDKFVRAPIVRVVESCDRESLRADTADKFYSALFESVQDRKEGAHDSKLWQSFRDCRDQFRIVETEYKKIEVAKRLKELGGCDNGTN